MKVLIYILCFLAAAIIKMIVDDSGIAYNIANFIGGNSGATNEIAMFSGLLSAVMAIAIYGGAFFLARKLSALHEDKQFYNAAARSGLSAFEYAKSIAPASLIKECDALIDQPYHVVNAKINDAVDAKQISQSCADALSSGYLNIVAEYKKAHKQ